MRVLTLLFLFAFSLFSEEKQDTETLWNDLAAKRAAAKTFHQEFEVQSTSTSAYGSRSRKHSLIVDWSNDVWRSKMVAGSGDEVTIFDGTDILHMEEGGDEYTRSKNKLKDGEHPAPAPYALDQADWGRAKELQRAPCQIPGMSHECAILNVPLKSELKSSGNHTIRIRGREERIEIDVVTGLILRAYIQQSMDPDSGASGLVTRTSYQLKNFSIGLAMDAELFKIPAGVNEVKTLSRWDAPRIKRALAGAAAPALNVKDIHGNALTLADLKGKTVLLDFWTTWCPPCRADAPAIDKLYEKYGGTELAVVGFSVNEDRAIVEKFLSQHAHDYPIVLTSENDMPRQYQIGVFPTYIVIGKDGTVASAVQGEKGFSDLKGLLKKAGLE